MGFYDDIMKIIDVLPKRKTNTSVFRQHMKNIENLASNILKEPVL